MTVIKESLIVLDKDIKNREDVISYLVDKMKNNNRTNNKKQLLRDVYIREDEASTSMGFGVAIPHAQSSAVLETSVIFLRLKEEIDWNNDNNIRLIFGIFVPEERAGQDHLKILAQIARKLINDEFRQNLLNVKSVKECKQLLDSINN